MLCAVFVFVVGLVNRENLIEILYALCITIMKPFKCICDWVSNITVW